MTTDGKPEQAPQDGEGDDALWRLLERAPRPRSVSPYFARRVLREAAALEERHATRGVSKWLVRLWQAGRRTPGVAFACVLVAVALTAAGGLGLSSGRWHAPAVAVAISPSVAAPGTAVGERVSPDALAEIDPVLQPTVAMTSEPIVTAQDVEVIADLDNVLSREESRLWTEDDTARF